MPNRDELHKNIDELPEQVAGELLDFARYLRQKVAQRAYDRGLASLSAAPGDDEPYTASDREEHLRARATYRREGGVSLEALRAELDLPGELAD